MDYRWHKCTDVKGLDKLGNPNEYSVVNHTFQVADADDDAFPKLDPK